MSLNRRVLNFILNYTLCLQAYIDCISNSPQIFSVSAIISTEDFEKSLFLSTFILLQDLG